MRLLRAYIHSQPRRTRSTVVTLRWSEELFPLMFARGRLGTPPCLSQLRRRLTGRGQVARSLQVEGQKHFKRRNAPNTSQNCKDFFPLLVACPPTSSALPELEGTLDGTLVVSSSMPKVGYGAKQWRNKPMDGTPQSNKPTIDKILQMGGGLKSRVQMSCSINIVARKSG